MATDLVTVMATGLVKAMATGLVKAMEKAMDSDLVMVRALHMRRGGVRR